MKKTILIAAALAVGLAFASPASAQVGQRMKNRMIDAAAKSMVSEIQNDSCADFATMLKSRQNKGGSSRTGGMMKNDPAARQRFVNQVAGPLVNKMIDCDLLPTQ